MYIQDMRPQYGTWGQIGQLGIMCHLELKRKGVVVWTLEEGRQLAGRWEGAKFGKQILAGPPRSSGTGGDSKKQSARFLPVCHTEFIHSFIHSFIPGAGF